MSPLTIQMPESIRRHLELLAARDGVTVDRFISSAAAEKTAAFLKVLRKVPLVQTEDWDHAASAE